MPKMRTSRCYIRLSILAVIPLAIAVPAPQASDITAPVRSFTSYTPGTFTGTPTVTGALNGTVQATAITPLPPNPAQTTYRANGQLQDPLPAPYAPAGGIGTNGTPPVYNVQSDFDYQSIV